MASNASIKAKIETAFTPYAQAYCKHAATLTVMVDDQLAYSVLSMTASDHKRLDEDAQLRSTITRAYVGLVRHLTGEGRNPILQYGLK